MLFRKPQKVVGLILILVLMVSSSFPAFATSELNNHSPQDTTFVTQYDSYLKKIQASSDSNEQINIRNGFLKDIGAKVIKMKVVHLRKNGKGEYELLDSYSLSDNNLEYSAEAIESTRELNSEPFSTTSNLLLRSSYQPGDMELIVLDSAFGTGYTDMEESSSFIGLLSKLVQVIVGIKVPAIGVASSIIGAIVPDTASYYYDTSRVFTSNDMILYSKIVNVYTSSGQWQTYAQSDRLDTDMDAVFKHYDGVRWHDDPKDYGKVKYEEGSHWSNHTYLYDMAYSRWSNNYSAWTEAYYTGTTWVKQSMIDEFNYYASQY